MISPIQSPYRKLQTYLLPSLTVQTHAEDTEDLHEYQGEFDEDFDDDDIKISSEDDEEESTSLYDAWKQGKFSFPQQKSTENSSLPARAAHYIRGQSDASDEEDDNQEEEEDNMSDDEKQHTLEEQMAKSKVDLDDLKLAITFSKSLPLSQQQKFFQQFFQYFRKEPVFANKPDKQKKKLPEIPKLPKVKPNAQHKAQNDKVIVKSQESSKPKQGEVKKPLGFEALYSAFKPDPSPRSVEEEEEELDEMDRIRTEIDAVVVELQDYVHSHHDYLFLVHLLRESKFMRGDQEVQTAFLEYLQNLRKLHTAKVQQQSVTINNNSAKPRTPTDNSKPKSTGSKPQEPTMNESFISQDESISAWKDISDSEEEQDEPNPQNHSQMAALAQEYSDEIVTNVILVQELDTKLGELIASDPKKNAKFSRENLEQIAQHFVESVKSKMGAIDSDLTNALRQVIQSYAGKDISTHKDSFIQEITSMVADDMIYSKVLSKVDKSYRDEITELEKEGDSLRDQRTRDLAKLREQRLQRLADIHPAERPSSPSQTPTKSTPLKHRPPHIATASVSSVETSMATRGSNSDLELESSDEDDKNGKEQPEMSSDSEEDVYYAQDKSFHDIVVELSKKSPKSDEVTIDDLPVNISSEARANLEQQMAKEQQKFMNDAMPKDTTVVSEDATPEAHPVGTTVPFQVINRDNVNPEFKKSFEMVTEQVNNQTSESSSNTTSEPAQESKSEGNAI